MCVCIYIYIYMYIGYKRMGPIMESCTYIHISGAQ